MLMHNTVGYRWGGRVVLSLVLAVVGWEAASGAEEQESLSVGLQADGRVVVPTNQILHPAGRQLIFPGHPVDLAVTGDGKTLVVKNTRNLLFVDLATARLRQTLESPQALGVTGLLVRDGRVYASGAENQVRIAELGANGSWEWAKSWQLPAPAVGGKANLTGLAWQGRDQLWVVSNRGNCLHLMDVATGNVRATVPVGVAPFTVCVTGPTRCYVSNWGGDLPAAGAATVPSSGTAVRVDPRTGIANHGSVSVVECVAGVWKQTRTIEVGLSPSGMALSPGARFLYVANANSDTVSVIDTRQDEVVEVISCRPEHRLPFGSGSNALALSADGATLYVANGTNNCLAVIALAARSTEARLPTPRSASVVAGLIPVGWFPGAVRITPDQQQLVVANIKGLGSLSQPRPVKAGRNSHDLLGSLSLVPVPEAAQLARYTAQVNANNRLAFSLSGLEPARAKVPPRPVPARHGEPSVFKHVIYVIKENRTYDQVFGDIKEGDGDPELVLFGEEVTPNHHALARQFTLFDNFYCSGICSADGHQWVNEAYVTDYLERAYGSYARSYPYPGDDPLAFAPSGFLWDNALTHRRTVRNYGEFTNTTLTPATATWMDLLADAKNGTAKIGVQVTPNVAPLKPFTHPNYPGFVMNVPDVYRAKLFIAELKKYEAQGSLPNLIYLYLPCDHTCGTTPNIPTPAAMVADNDLALGQVVEAVSNSRFWKETCIVVVEDDPQAGFDHVDGHRTVALVVSPYNRRRTVDHTNYNQTGMVKTIELILGLPPMNQLDLSATAMRACFQDTPDFTPYAALPNRIPLEQLNPPLSRLTGPARHFAEASLKLDFSREDRADEDTFNRILWHSVKGDRAPYPAQYAANQARDDDETDAD